MRVLDIVVIQISPEPITLLGLGEIQCEVRAMPCMAIPPGVDADGCNSLLNELTSQSCTSCEDLHCNLRSFTGTAKSKNMFRYVFHAKLIKIIFH